MKVMVSLVSLLAVAGPRESSGPAPDRYPFGVGEHLEYSAKFGMLKLGEASMQVTSLDTVRGRETFRIRYQLEGGNFMFKIRTVLESWTTVDGFKSLRFKNDNTENGKTRVREYEIFPDSGFYRQSGRDTTFTTPEQPLDDASLLYFVRSAPLEVGKSYRFDKYYVQEKNPLLIRVLKRETMELPDGTKVDCLVLNPVVDDKGMFADRAEARLWLTNDDRRIPVQIRSKYPWGTVTLRLEKMTLAGD